MSERRNSNQSIQALISQRENSKYNLNVITENQNENDLER